MLEVADRRAFAQELGIGDDGNRRGRILLADDALDLVAGADWNRRLGDHHRPLGKYARDLARRRIDIGKIGMAVTAARRRADRNEYHFRFAYGRFQVARK